MVLLHLRTDNLQNLILAKFDSIYDRAYIQFSNINNVIYYAGLSNNSIKIYNPNNSRDNGLVYSSNILDVDCIDTQIIKNYNQSVFPNYYTLLDEYSFTEPSTISLFDFSRCFDLDLSSYWMSANVYSPITGLARTDDNTYKFQESYGHWIKIKFPYAIIPIGFSVNSISNIEDPVFFDVYVSNDNINWTKILVVNSIITSAEFYFRNNTTFYLYMTIVVTKININLNINSFQSFKIYELKVFSSPILNLDTKVKICNNNLYNISSLNTKSLLINDVPITTQVDLNNLIIAQAVESFRTKYGVFWNNNNGTGFLDSNIVTKIAINSNIANSYLEVYGDIAYKHRSMNNKIVVNNAIFNYSSAYVYIGKITFSNNIKNYFNLSIYLYELDKFYFQTINIYGYSFISNSLFNAYWDTSFDNSYNTQRIVEIIYVYDTILSTKTSIKFYIKYNDLLDLTKTQVISSSRDFVNNLIFIDALNTSSSSDIEFFPPTTNEVLGNINFFKANLLSSIILNKDGSYYSNLSASNLILNNPSFISNNFLMIGSNKVITDTGISSNIFGNLKNLNSNRVLISDNNGFINTIDVSSSLISNINYNSKINSSILISSNNLFEAFTINKNNLSNLNNIHLTPNSILIINNNNQLQTTTTVRTDNISNVLQLFNFNTNDNFAFCNSNLKINSFNITSNLFIGNNIITSNYKFNRITVNNREIADDIFKLIIKVPGFNDSILSTVHSVNSGIINYSVRLNSGFNINLEVDRNDDNTDITRKVYNIFNKSKTNFWLSQANFRSYLNTSYGADKYLYNDPNLITRCGAYIIIDLGQRFVLNMYAIYVNYNNLVNSIRDFKLFGYSSNNTWVLLDNEVNQQFLNNLTPNVFRIDRNKFDIYTKYAICIINTHNTDQIVPSAITINGIEFYGYPINNDYYNSSNTITYNYENNLTLLSFSNVGINNINPYCYLSIGNDLVGNSRETLLNLNHPFPITSNNLEKPLINMTRPSSNINGTGIKVSHYLNSWYNSNTNYTIKLSHNNADNEQVVLSMNSDGKVAIGGYPNCNLNSNGLSLFNTGINFHNSNNYINITTSNISSNYSVILPPSPGIYDTTFFVNAVSNNILYMNFDDPVEKMVRKPHIKFGDQSLVARKENGVVIQIAGNCLIGRNIATNQLNASFLNNTLCVAGTIYSTVDISTDSDISYKYNIRTIKDPLDKINKINGYTFNRYDTNDDNRYTGLIAQEVLKVMPEVIIKKHDGKYRIIYNNLAGLFVEGIKKLDTNLNWLEFKFNISVFFFSMALVYLFNK